MKPVRLEPRAPRSRVKHSTTEPLGFRLTRSRLDNYMPVNSLDAGCLNMFLLTSADFFSKFFQETFQHTCRSS